MSAERKKIILRIAAIHFLLLSILSVCWRWERTAMDNSTVLFNIVSTGRCLIFSHRFIIAVAQLPTLLGVRAGLPLDILAGIHSLGYTCLAGLVLICGICFGISTRYIIAALLSTIVCVRMNFFIPKSELFIAMMIGIIAVGVLKRHHILYYFLFLFLSFLSFITHPLMILFLPLLVFFVSLYDFHPYPIAPFWRGAFFGILTACCAGFSWFTSTPYEAGLAAGGLHIAGTRDFLLGYTGICRGLIVNHGLFLLSFIFLAIHLSYSSRWTLFFMNIIVAIGYLFILSDMDDISVSLLIPDIEGQRFFYPLEMYFVFQAIYVSAEICAKFRFLFLPLVLLLSAIIIFQFTTLWEPYIMFNNKIKVLSSINAKALKEQKKKVLIDRNTYKRLDILTSDQFELGLLLSARDGASHAVQIVVADSALRRICDTLAPTRLYLTPSATIDVRDLPATYFDIAAQPYRELPISMPYSITQPWLEKYRRYAPLGY